MFVNTNIIFLEDDYMMNNKSRSEVDWRVLNKTPTIAQNTIDLVPTHPISST